VSASENTGHQYAAIDIMGRGGERQTNQRRKRVRG